MKYERTVIAYHGCDAETAELPLRGELFKKSQNDYDWLGEGIYFWEYGADRALQFARDQQQRRKLRTPAIVGAILQLGRCPMRSTCFSSSTRNRDRRFRTMRVRPRTNSCGAAIVRS